MHSQSLIDPSTLSKAQIQRLFKKKRDAETKKILEFINYFGDEIEDYERTEDKYAGIDLKFTSKNPGFILPNSKDKEFVAEVKVRECNLLTYKKLILERSKYEKIIDAHFLPPIKAGLFINFFSCGAFIIFNITERIKCGWPLKFEIRKLPTNHLMTDYKEKWVTMMEYNNPAEFDYLGYLPEPIKEKRRIKKKT